MTTEQKELLAKREDLIPFICQRLTEVDGMPLEIDQIAEIWSAARNATERSLSEQCSSAPDEIFKQCLIRADCIGQQILDAAENLLQEEA